MRKTVGKPQAMLENYDRDMLGEPARSYYEDSAFYNYGYWQPGTRTQRQASENLVEKLLSMLPQRSGRVLDVACGIGGSTRYITKYFEPKDVFAVNLSDAQIGQTHRTAPDCGVAVMDAARLAFGDQVFDSLVCVESAFHFETREAFFKEAHRVLKPGGALVMSDVLVPRMSRSLAERAQLPAANQLDGPEQYRRTLSAKGFRDVEVIDATNLCSRSFSRHLLLWPFRSLWAEPSSYRSFLPRLKAALVNGALALLLKHYLIVSAIKDEGRLPGAEQQPASSQNKSSIEDREASF